MAVHCLDSGSIGLHIPSDLEISIGPQDVPRASGNLLVVGDVQPNTSPLSAVYVYNTSRLEAVYGHSLIVNPSVGTVRGVLVVLKSILINNKECRMKLGMVTTY